MVTDAFIFLSLNNLVVIPLLVACSGARHVVRRSRAPALMLAACLAMGHDLAHAKSTKREQSETVESDTKTRKAGWVRLNELFGVKLWSDYNLWDDPESNVARRIGLPEESRTSCQASYRAYLGGKHKVLGEPCYSFALFSETGYVSNISIVFANKGDMEGLASGVRMDDDKETWEKRATLRNQALKTYKKRISEAAENVEKALTSLLRAPKTQIFGEGDKNTTEEVKRWNVKGHAILLAAPKDEYVAIRIVPRSLADAEGAAEHLSDNHVRETLASRVVHRENGDVIIKDIPMVDQGPKGFCAPATWERYLRYIGIPADMYLLAMAAHTGAGGGTSIGTMVRNVNRLIRRHGRRMKFDKRRPLIKHIDEYIDYGVPIIWPVAVDKEFYVEEIHKRTAERRKATDMKAWRDSLKPCRRAAKNMTKPWGGGHVCMIIGYNKKTREIATSDSWGALFEERWMTEEEVDSISLGGMYVIKW